MSTVALITSGANTIVNFRGMVIEELRRRGHRVLALAPDWTDAVERRARELGAEPVHISLSRAGLDPRRDMIDMVKLAATLRRLKPDAVLTYFAKPNVYGMLAARAARVKRRVAMVEGLGFAFDSSAGDSAGRKLVGLLARGLFRAAFAGAHRVVFLNGDDHDFFVSGGLVDDGKAINIGAIGVDLDQFAPAPPVLDPPSFLLMARLLRGKGVLEFAEAAALVRRRYPRARFVLLGDFDANPDSLAPEDLEPWIASGAVEWKGHVNDVRQELARASVFVLPAYCREGLPRSSQEASAMAKPVITTSVVGCRDTVEDGVNGLIVRPRDVDGLAQAMFRFIERPEDIISMGAAGRRFAEKHYDGREKSSLLVDLLVPREH